MKSLQKQALFSEFLPHIDKLIAENATEEQTEHSGFVSLDFYVCMWQIFVHSFHYCIIK